MSLSVQARRSKPAPRSASALLEFDPAKNAPHSPSPLKGVRFPSRAVLCLFQDVLDALKRRGRIEPLGSLPTEAGRWDFHLLKDDGPATAVFHPGLGAPVAAAMLEHAIASGARKFVVCGSAGVLDESIERGTVLLASEAVRDEGTSHHYLPPSRTVRAPAGPLRKVRSLLERRGLAHLSCKTWTTDAIYRETSRKISARAAEGCSAVEMEAAALFAVARFRGVDLGAMFYAMDSVRPNRWRGRGWHVEDLAKSREELFWLAVAACRIL